jgi:hypothetical protein
MARLRMGIACIVISAWFGAAFACASFEADSDGTADGGDAAETSPAPDATPEAAPDARRDGNATTCTDASDVFCEDFDEVGDPAALAPKWGALPDLAVGGTLAIVSPTMPAPTPPHALEAVTPPDAGAGVHAAMTHIMVATSPTSTHFTCDVDIWVETFSNEMNALTRLLQLELTGDELAAGTTQVTLLVTQGSVLQVRSATSPTSVNQNAVTTLTSGWRHLRVEVRGGPGDAGAGSVTVYLDRATTPAATASSVTSRHLAHAQLRLGLVYEEYGTNWRAAFDNLVCAFGP